MRAGSHPPDYFMITIIAVICIFGLVMLSSASSVSAFQKYEDANYLIKRQLISFIIGIFAFFLMSRIDYRYWKKWAFPFLIGSIVLLILVFVPGIGTGALGGAKRWINLSFLSFQPSEVVKLIFLLYLAAWFDKRGQGIKNISAGLTPFIILLGIITLLIMRQPDMGTMIVIAVISISSYFVAGAPMVHLAWIGLGTGGLFALLIGSASYRAQRFSVFLNPELDPQGIGYHINQALLAVGSGGILGLGLGHSRQKFNYLPQASTDSIFAVIAEELGFIVVLILIVLFLTFMIRGFKIARSSPDNYGKILAVGITAWFTFQALMNIGTMTALLPLTGIPLPFISYGGTALIVSMAAVGILVNISKHTKEQTSFWR